VTVEVGTEANGGNFGFGPAAVRVDPGTTVTWEWVAGSHNVEAEDGSFESELTDETGFTFDADLRGRGRGEVLLHATQVDGDERRRRRG